MPPPPKLPSRYPVTWADAKTVVVVFGIVVGGVMKVDADIDNGVKEIRRDMVAGDLATAKAVKQHVSEVYARKTDVAKNPVEASELTNLRSAVKDNGDKLDRLRTLILKRH